MVLRRLALCGLVMFSAAIAHSGRGERSTPAPRLDRAEAIRRLRAMPLAFEENRGQTAAEAAWVARGQGYAMWATARGPLIRLGGGKTEDARVVLRLRAVGATMPAAVAEEPLNGRANYFIGNDPGQWITQVPRVAALRYPGVYPGIDLVLHGTQQSLEYDFELRPHADPSQIAVAFDGIDGLRLEPDGDLSLTASSSELRFHRPVAYQDGRSGRELVDAHYQVEGGEVRFVLGDYDRSRRLVIDPVVDYSTYLGGTKTFTNGVSVEDAYGLAIDAAGNAYLTGFTNAVDFPMAGASFDLNCGGCGGSGGDAFVAKIDPSQSGAASLVYATYLGSPGIMSSVGNAVAVDQSGAVYVTGWTSAFDSASTPINDAFPLTPSAFQLTDGGDLAMSDAFLTKLDAGGSSLLYSTYIGGNNVDEGYGVQVDGVGHAYVTGRAASPVWTAVKNGVQMSNSGVFDAFLIKVDTLGSGPASLVYGTLLGGVGSDAAEAVAIDAQGRAFITGNTQSTSGFPIVNGFQTVNGPGTHAFMAAVDPSLSGAASLLYSTFIGTTGSESASLREGGIAVDEDGMVYVTGSTFGGGFTTTPGAHKSVVQSSDVYVMKIDPTVAGAASLVASTLLGGSGQENSGGIAIDGFGNPVVAGWTQSLNFVIAGCGLPKNNSADAFVTVLMPDLTGLHYSTVIGGAGSDFGHAVAVAPSGAIYLAGGTDSTNFPTTANAFDPTHQSQCSGCGTRDAFLARITAPLSSCPAPPIAIGSTETTPEDMSKSITLNATDLGGFGAPAETLTWTITTPPSHGTLDIVSGTMAHDAGKFYSVTIVYTPAADYSGPDSFQFVANDGTGDSNLATVAITVVPANDSPTANPDAASTPEDTAVTIAVLANDADAEGDPLSIVGVKCDIGTWTDNGDGTIGVTPPQDFNGQISCGYTVSDSQGGTATAGVSITVTPVNDAPIAMGDIAATTDTMAIVIPVLSNDVDPDGDLVALGDAGTCAHGTVTANADGTILYTPTPGFVGSDTCDYTAIDIRGGVSSAVITITVTKSNGPPVIDNPGDQVTAEGTSVTLAITASDPDNDALTYTANGLPSGLGIGADGVITGAPGANSAGSYPVTVTVDDGHGGTASTSFIWVVTPPSGVNQPPVCFAAGPSIGALWPPNHRLEGVSILGVTDPDGGVPQIRITRIVQDEPTNTVGDANTWIDGFGVGAPIALVRAERTGTPKVPGDGRIYEIGFEATDEQGASCTGVVTVGVPHDMGKGPAIDSGVRYDSTLAGAPAVTPKKNK